MAVSSLNRMIKYVVTQLVGCVIEAQLLPCKRVCCEGGRQPETTGMGSNPIHILNCFRSATITGVGSY